MSPIKDRTDNPNEFAEMMILMKMIFPICIHSDNPNEFAEKTMGFWSTWLI